MDGIYGTGATDRILLALGLAFIREVFLAEGDGFKLLDVLLGGSVDAFLQLSQFTKLPLLWQRLIGFALELGLLHVAA